MHTHSLQGPCSPPWLSLAGWVLSPCSIPGDAQPRLGRVVMPRGNFWQHQTSFKLLPLLLQDHSVPLKNFMLCQCAFSGFLLCFKSNFGITHWLFSPADTHLFTMMGFGKHPPETAVCFICTRCVLSHLHLNRGCCSGHLPRMFGCRGWAGTCMWPRVSCSPAKHRWSMGLSPC